MFIREEIIKILKKTDKNLLAYSGGTDSNCLFNLLIENNIDFDLIHVNYNTRKESLYEEELAKKLAKKYNKKLYLKSVNIKNLNLKGKGGFEKVARDIRYVFFKEIIKKYNYENLITGHNLNDKMEWFLMRMSKGAGIEELYGMDFFDKRDRYTIIRPILDKSKNEIMKYLNKNNIEYSYDISNDDTENYERNKFRHTFVNQFVKEYGKGIKKTFDILREEVKIVKNNYKLIFKDNKRNVVIYKFTNDYLKPFDKGFKILGYVMNEKQRKNIKEKKEIVLKFNEKILTGTVYEDKVIIVPYITSEEIKLPKNIKEIYRKYKIPPKIRKFLYLNSDIFEFLTKENLKLNRKKSIKKIQKPKLKIINR